MTGWNPNFRCAQGLEWGTERQADRPVTGRGPAGYAWSISSSVSEDVTGLWTFSQGRVDNALDLIDIYDVADLRAVPTVENISEPGGTVVQVGSAGRPHQGARWDGTEMVNFRAGSPPAAPPAVAWPSGIANMADVLGTFGNLTPGEYQSTFVGAAQADKFISEGLEGQVQTPHHSFLGFTPITRAQLAAGWRWGDNASAGTYPFRVEGLDTGLTAGTDRVLAVSTSVLAQKIVRNDLLQEFGGWPVVLEPFLLPAAGWTGSGRGPVFGQRFVLSTAAEQFGQTWAVNPFTGREWTPAELADFATALPTGSNPDTGARIGWRVRSIQRGVTRTLLRGRPAVGDDERVYGAMESVAGAIYAADFRTVAVEDTRVAFAFRAGNRTQKTGWNEWVVEAIGGGDWQKVAGAEYLFHQVVDEAAFGGGAVARGLNVRVLSSRLRGGQVPVRERVPEFAGSVPVSAGDVRPWSPAVVLEFEP